MANQLKVGIIGAGAMGLLYAKEILLIHLSSLFLRGEKNKAIY